MELGIAAGLGSLGAPEWRAPLSHLLRKLSASVDSRALVPSPAGPRLSCLVPCPGILISRLQFHRGEPWA